MNSADQKRLRRQAITAMLGLCVAVPAARAQDAPGRPAVAIAGAAPGGVILSPPTTPQQKSLLLEMQDAFTNIAQTVEPTVVHIKSERLVGAGAEDGGDGSGAAPPRGGLPFGGPGGPPRGPRRSQATGSGVIVRADGYILTNDHVVDGAVGGVVTVTLYDGREFKGRVFPDYKSDLAIVKIEPGATQLPTATFADAALVRPGQWAVAVGSPFDLQNTVTVGIISAIGRHERITGEGQARYYPDLIQTDAAINPGNSGGPLFNIDGKIVGINVAIETPSDAGGSVGVGFAIPVTIAQTVANALIAQGKVRRGYLGLAPIDLTPAAVEQYGQKQGAFVQDIVLDSPAGKAGLQAADIVTSFDGKPVTDEVTLRLAISATTPGQKVIIAYVRDGVPATATATIAPPPGPAADPPAPATPATPAKRKLGLGVRDLTARDRLALGLPADATGVAVASVTPGGPAESAAVGAGFDLTRAVIQKVNRTPVHTKQEFSQAVAASGSSPITLIVVFNDEGITHQQALTLRL